MKFLHIVWKNLLRRKIRTTFTLLSIFVAFVLFGYLMAVRSAFNMGVDLAGADRLMVLNKISIIMPVPKSYIDKVRAIEGVKDVTHANWFGAYYQETRNQFPNMAVDPESWLRMYPEFQVPEDQKKAWLADPPIRRRRTLPMPRRGRSSFRSCGRRLPDSARRQPESLRSATP